MTTGVRWWKSTVDGLSLRCRLGFHSDRCEERDYWIVRLKAEREAKVAEWDRLFDRTNTKTTNDPA